MTDEARASRGAAPCRINLAENKSESGRVELGSTAHMVSLRAAPS